jgi:hypothetical protein
LAIDQASLTALEELHLPRLRPLNLSHLETPELLAIKPDRTRAEYCWTLTPSSKPPPPRSARPAIPIAPRAPCPTC